MLHVALAEMAFVIFVKVTSTDDVSTLEHSSPSQRMGKIVWTDETALVAVRVVVGDVVVVGLFVTMLRSWMDG